LKTIGHSLKSLGPSQKTLRHPWCLKLVTGLLQPSISLVAEYYHFRIIHDLKSYISAESV